MATDNTSRELKELSRGVREVSDRLAVLQDVVLDMKKSAVSRGDLYKTEFVSRLIERKVLGKSDDKSSVRVKDDDDDEERTHDRRSDPSLLSIQTWKQIGSEVGDFGPIKLTRMLAKPFTALYKSTVKPPQKQDEQAKQGEGDQTQDQNAADKVQEAKSTDDSVVQKPESSNEQNEQRVAVLQNNMAKLTQILTTLAEATQIMHAELSGAEVADKTQATQELSSNQPPQPVTEPLTAQPQDQQSVEVVVSDEQKAEQAKQNYLIVQGLDSVDEELVRLITTNQDMSSHVKKLPTEDEMKEIVESLIGTGIDLDFDILGGIKRGIDSASSSLLTLVKQAWSAHGAKFLLGAGVAAAVATLALTAYDKISQSWDEIGVKEPPKLDTVEDFNQEKKDLAASLTKLNEQGSENYSHVVIDNMHKRYQNALQFAKENKDKVSEQDVEQLKQLYQKCLDNIVKAAKAHNEMTGDHIENDNDEIDYTNQALGYNLDRWEELSRKVNDKEELSKEEQAEYDNIKNVREKRAEAIRASTKVADKSNVQDGSNDNTVQSVSESSKALAAIETKPSKDGSVQRGSINVPQVQPNQAQYAEMKSIVNGQTVNNNTVINNSPGLGSGGQPLSATRNYGSNPSSAIVINGFYTGD